MANTLKFGNGEWAIKEGSALAYNDENSNFKPLPFDFTRASTATYVAEDGLIKTAASGVPRIDFLDSTSGSLKLEPQRTNLVTHSSDFLDSSWNVFRGSVTADVIISPDGTQNASRYQEDSQTGSHLFRRQSLSITNGLSYTGSIFIKKGELTEITLQSNSSSRWVASAIFDVENGVVTSGTGVIEDYGNGWYRCSISGNAVQTTTVAGLEMYTSVGTGRDGDGLYMYGAMFEQGSYATSIIKTSGATATRVADDCSQTPPDGIIGQTEGVLYAEIKANETSNSSSRRVISLSDLTNTNRVYISFDDEYNQLNIFIIVGGTTVTVSNVNISNQNNYNKVAVRYKSGDSAIYVNGVLKNSFNDTFSSGVFNALKFKNRGAGEIFYGNVKDVRVYNEALTDQELATLTT